MPPVKYGKYHILYRQEGFWIFWMRKRKRRRTKGFRVYIGPDRMTKDEARQSLRRMAQTPKLHITLGKEIG